ncbi:MAG: hypothetical protein IJ873_00425 [Lachnospiraceae bacterium]|nr:hypothetical protein [Lachnospiraceae bacterium]
MQYEFLKNFPKRMKNVGLYAVLVQNIVYKTQKWNHFSIPGTDEQINLVFSVLLLLMEHSLKEQPCTVDDIAVYIDAISTSDFEWGLSFDTCRELADFIVNSVLSNEGEQMSFDGFDYDEKAYHTVPIRYVTNQIVYLDGEVKRTSYHLTDDGYNLLLSTLEIESNMRLSVQELLFQMQMEAQDYDHAVDTIKDIFDSMRRQAQKIREAMVRIRRNALNYSVSEYDTIIHENLDSISETSKQFEVFRDLVIRRRSEIEEIRINVRNLTEEEVRNLRDLGVIGSYLDRVLEEHLKILSSHLELKALYTRELENLSQVSQIRRFSIRDKLYDPIIQEPELLGELGTVLSPLFRSDPEKIYDPLRSASLQRPIHSRKEEETAEELDFDEEAWEAERERLRKEKRKKYQDSLSVILSAAMEKGRIKLSELKDMVQRDEIALKQLIPTIDVFKEIMVELLKSRELDIPMLRQERRLNFTDNGEVFEPNIMILELLEHINGGTSVRRISIVRKGNGKVLFQGIEDEQGNIRTIRCSEVEISLYKTEE